MNILELAGYNRRMARELSIWLSKRCYVSAVQRKRFRMICRDEVKAIIDPDSVDSIDSIYPRICGTFLSGIRIGVKLDSEKMDEISDVVMPYLTRILRGTKCLRKYMDVSVIGVEHMQALLMLFGLDNKGPNYTDASVEEFEFNEAAAQFLASLLTGECYEAGESQYDSGNEGMEN